MTIIYKVYRRENVWRRKNVWVITVEFICRYKVLVEKEGLEVEKRDTFINTRTELDTKVNRSWS